MKRQHPYDEKCRCRRCQAVKRLVLIPPKLSNPIKLGMSWETYLQILEVGRDPTPR